MQPTGTTWGTQSQSHSWFRRPWARKHTDQDMSSYLKKDYNRQPLQQQYGSDWSHSTTSLGRTSPNQYNQHGSYNQHSQYGQSNVSLVSTTAPYGYAKANKMHDIIQEMEQDEERRLAQVRQDSGLPAQSSLYDRKDPNSFGGYRPGFTARHELPMNTQPVYVAQLPDFGSRNSMTLVQAGHLHNNTVKSQGRHFSEMEDSSKVLPTELDVPAIKISTPNYDPYSKEISILPSELESQTDSKDWSRFDVKSDVHELPPDNLFTDIDIITSNQNPYAARRISDPATARRTSDPPTTRRISSPTAIELDGGYTPTPPIPASPPVLKLPEIPELGDPSMMSPTTETTDKRNSSKSLPPLPGASPPAQYGDRRYRTLAGEPFPINGRWSG